ncbi:MAG: hypothetical protein IID32_00210, partial [Planctomycetes bacterium]|nr:hypothetical protein [Planctomycetota bacterium]
DFPFYDVLLHESKENLIEVARYNKEFASLSLSSPFRGELFWDMTQNSMIVYTHSKAEVFDDNSADYYVLNYFNLEENIIQKIRHEFTPVTISQEEKDKHYKERYENTHEGRIHLDLLQNTQFYPPILDLFADGNTVFVSVKVPEDNKNILMHIFHENGKFLRLAYFSIKPDVIKNGYAYRIAENNDGFAIIEKYRIDPAVYIK